MGVVAARTASQGGAMGQLRSAGGRGGRKQACPARRLGRRESAGQARVWAWAWVQARARALVGGGGGGGGAGCWVLGTGCLGEI